MELATFGAEYLESTEVPTWGGAGQPTHIVSVGPSELRFGGLARCNWVCYSDGSCGYVCIPGVEERRA